MRKIILWIVALLFIALYAIDKRHRDIQRQWGEWKELTLDGAHPEKPGTCFYCEYIKPLISKVYEQEKK